MNTFGDSNYESTLKNILASKPLRRLKGKKQVFSLLVAQTNSKADYIHERLLHTLEVCSVAKEIIKHICNEKYHFTMKDWSGREEELSYSSDLLEAIAFAHDFGHTPFGHIGEQALTNYMQGLYPSLRTFKSKKKKHGVLVFKHNYYSAALLYRNFTNCPPEIIDGVLKHTKINKFGGTVYKYKGVFGANNFLPETLRKKPGYLNNNACYTLEGQVVAMADEVAQMLSDLEDSNNAIEHLFTDDDKTNILFKTKNQTMKDYLSSVRKEMVASIITQSKQNIQNYLNGERLDSRVVYFNKQVVDFDSRVSVYFKNLENLRGDRLHCHEKVKKQNSLSYLIIYKIFDFYLKKPDILFGNDTKCLDYVANNFIQIRDDSKYKKNKEKVSKFFAFIDYVKKKYGEDLLKMIISLKKYKFGENLDEYRKDNRKNIETICKELGCYYFTRFGSDDVMDSLAMSLMREISFSIGKMTDNFAVDVFFKSFGKDIKSTKMYKYIEKSCAENIRTKQYSIDENYLTFFKNRLSVLKTCLTAMGDYNKV